MPALQVDEGAVLDAVTRQAGRQWRQAVVVGSQQVLRVQPWETLTPPQSAVRGVGGVGPTRPLSAGGPARVVVDGGGDDAVTGIACRVIVG